MEELLEAIELLRNLMLARATGGSASDQEYRRLREALLEHPDIGANGLPRCVRTCPNLDAFWPFIQSKGGYQARREYLSDAFQPLIDELEGRSASPSDGVVADVVDHFDAEKISQDWREALSRRADDPDGAITSARTLLESTCKHILDQAGVTYDDKIKLPKLYQLTAKQLKLAPNQQTEATLRQVTGGCAAVVSGIGAMRNKLGDAHGRGPVGPIPAPRHAQLAVNLAGALATFLLETAEESD